MNTRQTQLHLLDIYRVLFKVHCKLEDRRTNWDQGPDSERHSISDRNVNTGALLIAQIHGYLLGLKSIKTLIVGLQKI